MLSRRSLLPIAGLALGSGALPAVARTSQRPKTVLLQCAWAVKNIGDIGHTPGTLRFREQFLSEANVVLWAQTPRPLSTRCSCDDSRSWRS
jgi:hypothetical protein